VHLRAALCTTCEIVIPCRFLVDKDGQSLEITLGLGLPLSTSMSKDLTSIYGDVRDGLIAIRNDAESSVDDVIDPRVPYIVQTTAWVSLEAAPEALLHASSMTTQGRGTRDSEWITTVLFSVVVIALLVILVGIAFVKLL
jgi:hypothetical protein